jgi:hypothetical protein
VGRDESAPRKARSGVRVGIRQKYRRGKGSPGSFCECNRPGRADDQIIATGSGRRRRSGTASFPNHLGNDTGDRASSLIQVLRQKSLHHALKKPGQLGQPTLRLGRSDAAPMVVLESSSPVPYHVSLRRRRTPAMRLSPEAERCCWSACLVGPLLAATSFHFFRLTPLFTAEPTLQV